MTFHTQVVGANGQRQAMFIERMEGLGEVILRNFDLGPPDAMMVFSAGGTWRVPIEVARGARAGPAVIAITSAEATRRGRPPTRRDAATDHADVLLDLRTPPADALVTIEGLEAPVGPGSTIAAVAWRTNSRSGPRLDSWRGGRCPR